jgi:hypothetical protein
MKSKGSYNHLVRRDWIEINLGDICRDDILDFSTELLHRRSIILCRCHCYRVTWTYENRIKPLPPETTYKKDLVTAGFNSSNNKRKEISKE